MAGSETVQSVERAIDILEAIAGEDSGLSLSEIATHLGIRDTTAFNLAKTLHQRGFLEKRTRPVRYTLGKGLLNLVSHASPPQWKTVAKDQMLEVYRQMNEVNLILAESSGYEFQTTFRLDARIPNRVVKSKKALAPYQSATGNCFQSFWSEAELTAFRALYPFSEYGFHTWKSEAKYRQALARFRTQGHVSITETLPHRIAFPIFNTDQEIIACLGAHTGHTPKHSPKNFDRLTTLLKTAAAVINQTSQAN